MLFLKEKITVTQYIKNYKMVAELKKFPNGIFYIRNLKSVA